MRIARQLNAALHVQCEHALLPDRLSFALVHPFFRTIGRDHQQRNTLVESLGNRGTIIQHRTSTGADQRDRRVELLRHTQSEEGRATFVDHLQAGDLLLLVECDH